MYIGVICTGGWCGDLWGLFVMFNTRFHVHTAGHQSSPHVCACCARPHPCARGDVGIRSIQR